MLATSFTAPRPLRARNKSSAGSVWRRKKKRKVPRKKRGTIKMDKIIWLLTFLIVARIIQIVYL